MQKDWESRGQIEKLEISHFVTEILLQGKIRILLQDKIEIILHQEDKISHLVISLQEIKRQISPQKNNNKIFKKPLGL